MRVLCTAVPSAGHLHPLLPLARALTAAGHEVTLASGTAAASIAEAAGIGFLAAGLDETDMIAAAASALPDQPAEKRGIAMFATIAAPALLHDLLPHLDRLAPDLIISEEGEWAGPVLAAILGVRAVVHGWGAPLWSTDELETIEAATGPLWRNHGVRPQTPAGLFDHVYLDACPPLLQDPRTERLPRQTIRFEPFDSGQPLPRSLQGPRARPLVYATLGTVPTFNSAPTILAAIADAIADLDVDAILTIGHNNDVHDLQPLPQNVHAQPHLSQVEALALSSVAITHGGAGSTLAALSFGVPLLLLPRGAPSQQRLADRCRQLGASIVLDREETTPAAIRNGLRRLLDDDHHQANAHQIRASMLAQPEATALVQRLETIATPK